MGLGISALDRTAWLQEMAGRNLDLLVIGGGLTGAGAAWDASCRGMAVGLLEEEDFGSGEGCSMTTRMTEGIHDLGRGKVQAVRSAGRECTILHDMAPHVTEPVSVLHPVNRKGVCSRAVMSARFYACDRLSGIRGNERRRICDTDETLSLEPMLRKDDLDGSGCWYEGRIQVQRLTMEVLKSARANGAMPVNYVRVSEYVYRGGRIAGVKVVDTVTGNEFIILAKIILRVVTPNHTGHGSKNASTERPLAAVVTKRIQLVADLGKLPLSHALYLRDGNHLVYAVPRGRKVDIYAVRPLPDRGNEQKGLTDEDRMSVLKVINRSVGGRDLELADIETGWAVVGFAPDMEEEARELRERQKNEHLLSDADLLVVAEGRPEDFRKRAEWIVDEAANRIQEEEGTIYPPSTTDRLAVSGGLPEESRYQDIYRVKRAVVKQGRSLGISIDSTFDLWSRYGSETTKVFGYFSATKRDEQAEERLLCAELLYAVHHEMALRASDFFMRRTGWLLSDRKKSEPLLAVVLSWMGRLLNWSDRELARQRNELELLAARVWGDICRISADDEEHSMPLELNVPFDTRFYA